MCKTESVQHYPEDFLILTARRLMMEYHAGQEDKAGFPYVYHCTRVGLLASRKGKTSKETKQLMAIGFLHDIVEDTDITIDQLQEILGDAEVVHSVQVLTREKGQTYSDYIHLIKENPLAARVKMVDLLDHLTYPNGYELPVSLKKRYHQALEQLMNNQEDLRMEFETELRSLT